MAKVIKPFRGCKDGEQIVTHFVPGDEVEGDLERVAIAEGWAEKSKARKAPAKNKARTAAPKNK